MYDFDVRKSMKSHSALKTACIAGAAVLPVFLALAVFASLAAKRGAFRPKTGADTAAFYRNLLLLDDALAKAEDGGVNPVHAENLLETLDRQAAGAEARLSLLKRYRALSKMQNEYFEGYCLAAARAAARYPHSALIAALYAEAMLSAKVDGMYTKLPAAGTETIRRTALALSEYGPLSEASLFPVAFCLYALSGALENIDSAAAVPHIERLVVAFAESQLAADAVAVSESMLVDAALVSIVKGGDGAASALSRLEPRK
ncbi:MAG: hypothetical protein LBH50_01840, partial [Spirochaetaceae bacterium]|nr:hypothetical protein [Spirochaetaceae bacterium]